MNEKLQKKKKLQQKTLIKNKRNISIMKYQRKSEKKRNERKR